MPAQTTTKTLRVIVDGKGATDLRRIAEEMGLLNKNTKSLSNNMSLLTNAFKGWVGYLGVREIVAMSDEMQNLSNRLKIVSKEGEDTGKVMVDILNLANETKQSVSGTAEVYNRLGSSLKQANASSGELLSLTKALINTFRVSGATTTETVNTIVQLSQAFSSGELRGQELRSVMEQNAELARILRERFGTDIYKKAADGAIRVTDVLRALAENQQRVNLAAQTLTPTFENTLTKALNTVRYGVFKLNEQFSLSQKFAIGVDFVFERLSVILTTLGTTAALLALRQLPALIASLQKLALTTLAFVRGNPLALALTAISIAVIATSKSIDDIVDKFRYMYSWVLKLILVYNQLEYAIMGIVEPLKNVGLISEKDQKMFEDQGKKVEYLKNRIKELQTPSAQDQTLLNLAGSDKNANKELEALIARLDGLFKGKEKVEKIKDILGDLNKEYARGAIGLSQYNAKLIDFQLYKVNREFKEGKFDVFEYNERIKDLKIADLNRELNAGAISLERFNEQARALELDQLNSKFEAGKVSLVEYNKELLKLSQGFAPGAALVVGTSNYIESVGTLAEGVAKGIGNVFSALEDNLVEMMKTGKFNFDQFANAIIEDLNRIIIRAAIIRPIAQGILGAIGGGGGAGAAAGQSYTDYSGYAAKGMAFDHGIQKFAKGGIVDSPTMFGYNNGKTGLMGEAGTEAILPLRRGSNGDLGVAASVTPVTITIINQTGAEVSASESTGPGGEKAIELLITSKVNEGISKGSFDRSFSAAYGFRRRGS